MNETGNKKVDGQYRAVPMEAKYSNTEADAMLGMVATGANLPPIQEKLKNIARVEDNISSILDQLLESVTRLGPPVDCGGDSEETT